MLILLSWAVLVQVSDAGAQKRNSDTLTYTNTSDHCASRNLPVVEFQFEYPKEMRLLPPAELGVNNYVKMELVDPSGFTVENFAVGPMSSEGGFSEDVLKHLAGQIISQLSGEFPRLKLLYGSMGKVGKLRGYEVGFASIASGTEQGQIGILGRMVLVPKDNRVGLVLFNLATSFSELKNVRDFGGVGASKVIQDSFQFVQLARDGKANP